MTDDAAKVRLVALSRHWRDFFRDRAAAIDNGWITTSELRDGAKIDTTAEERAFSLQKMSEFEEIINEYEGSNAQGT